MDKKIWQSKTFWANVVALVAALLPPVRDLLTQMGWSTEIVVSLIAVVNIVLRFVTKQPIKVK